MVRQQTREDLLQFLVRPALEALGEKGILTKAGAPTCRELLTDLLDMTIDFTRSLEEARQSGPKFWNFFRNVVIDPFDREFSGKLDEVTRCLLKASGAE